MKLLHKGEHNFPFKYSAIQKYTLSKNSLIINIKIKNIDIFPFDVGIGFHPWFKISKKSELFSNTFNYIDYKNNKFKTKNYFKKKTNSILLYKNKIDRSFIGWNGKSKLIINKNISINITNKKNVNKIHIYSPKNKDFFCIEPTTNIDDAFNLKKNGSKSHGLKKIKPKEEFEASVSFDIIRN